MNEDFTYIFVPRARVDETYLWSSGGRYRGCSEPSTAQTLRGSIEVFGTLFETHRPTLRRDDRFRRAGCVRQEGLFTVEKTLIDMYFVNA